MIKRCTEHIYSRENIAEVVHTNYRRMVLVFLFF